MDELSLIVEAIRNKVKRLLISNTNLKDRISDLEGEKKQLEEMLSDSENRINQLETALTREQLVKGLGDSNSVRAVQKVDELLREIEKCHVLLNNR